MYLHKEERELFHDVILLTSQKMNVSEDIVEKDYYVTLILKELSKSDYPIVFKGGTSLSKAFRVIDRFSEDIDITFTEHLGESRRKKLKYNIIKPAGDNIGLEIKNWDSIESDKNLNHYDLCYDSVVGDEVINSLPPFVKLETSLMSYAFPTEERQISNYIYDALSEEEPELIEKYGLEPFPMRVQSLSRTLVDKAFALCDYYMLERPRRNARHLYDIYKLSPYMTFDDQFKKLVAEVREHRQKMDERIAPSARKEVDILAMVKAVCATDFYKADYEDTTLKLISDAVPYETVRDHYLKIAGRIFGDI